MKMIKKERLTSKALEEVWKCKDEAYKDIKNKTFKEKQKYYREGLKKAVRLLNRKLRKNPDGSYFITRS